MTARKASVAREAEICRTINSLTDKSLTGKGIATGPDPQSSREDSESWARIQRDRWSSYKGFFCMPNPPLVMHSHRERVRVATPLSPFISAL